jgi:hypothetical protein
MLILYRCVSYVYTDLFRRKRTDLLEMSLWFIFIFKFSKVHTLGSASKNLSSTLSSHEIWSEMFIPDPRILILISYPSRTPVPGVKKAPDSRIRIRNSDFQKILLYFIVIGYSLRFFHSFTNRKRLCGSFWKLMSSCLQVHVGTRSVPYPCQPVLKLR